MKKFCFLLLIATLLFSCKQGGQQNKKNDDKPVITVTIEPLRYFTEAIAGDEFTVVSMVPKGSSPETYDPTPQQLVDLAQSKAYFRIGYIGFEQTWTEKLTDNAPHLQFFDMSENVELILDDTHAHHHKDGHVHEGHTHAGGVEPHIWNSTINAQIIAGNILNALCAIDKANESVYMERYNVLIRQIEHTDSLICQMLSSPNADRAFMIYHPALSYFARDYNLNQIPIEAGGKEPSPAHLKSLINSCKKEKVRIIFVQPEFDRRNADLIAQQTGTRVVAINPLSYDWEEEMMNTAQALLTPVPLKEKENKEKNMLASPIIEIKNLSAGYDNRTVLHDVNLTIYERDFLGIIGPNGGGKTTLIKCILGLLKPTAGEILYHTDSPSPEVAGSQCLPLNTRLSMGYLPQYSSIDRKFPITVEEVILSGLSSQKPLASRFNTRHREKARHVIARMGLEGMEQRAIGALSGGQLQRALLGRAIISDPQVVILDEPSTYIDKRFEARLYELLTEINEECAIILVSHDIGTVLQQVKSIACVNETLDYHPDTGVTEEWLERNFNCPIELLGHGTLPHRILGEHKHAHE